MKKNGQIRTPGPRCSTSSTSSTLISGLIVAVIAIVGGAGACGNETKPTVDQQGEVQCGDCGQWAYSCQGGGMICAPDYATAADMGCFVDESKPRKNCAGNNQGSGTGGHADESGDPPGQCQDWDPDGLVSFNRRTRAFEVDQQLIDDLEQKPSLLSCDGSKSVLQSGGFFMLRGLGRDDLASHLGLRDGDIVKSLNGLELRFPDDYFAVFGTLADATSFTLVVNRRGVDVELNFVVV
jgi:hypothetical protein